MIALTDGALRGSPQPEREKPLIIISVGSTLADSARKALKGGAERITYDSERYHELRKSTAEASKAFVVSVGASDVGALAALEFNSKGYQAIVYNNLDGSHSSGLSDLDMPPRR